MNSNDDMEATLKSLVDHNPELADYAAWVKERRLKNARTEVQLAEAEQSIGTIVDSVISDQPVERRSSADRRVDTAEQEHPLFGVFADALVQAMYGKGERHGGARVPFLEQPWLKLANTHGTGFLSGQAVKKVEEAVRGKEGEAFEKEILGGIVYLGMTIIHHRMKGTP